MNAQYDVIVIGGGGSGLAAAVSAVENGGKVVLLEKQPQLGGSTGIAVGSFTTSQTEYQKRAGVEDRLEDHFEDAAKFASEDLESRNNDEMRRFHLANSAETLIWLKSMGLAFHGPSPEPPNRVPRMHNVVPNAKAYIAALQARFLRMGGEILCDAPAEELILTDGRVEGVIASVKGQRREFRANKGVILAAGDYASSPELIGKYKGQEFTNIEAINPYCHGDGHRLAESAGAPLINMDVTYGPELRFIPPPKDGFLQLLPASGPLAKIMGWFMPFVPQAIINIMIKRLLVTWQHPENAMFDDGAILINARGERFCNETQFPQREIAIANQPEKICYILLDERMIKRYSEWPHFISTAPEIAYAYVADYLRLRPDVSVQSSSLEGLARLRHLPEDTVAQTVAEYNRYATGEAPDPLGRQGDKNPLKGNRWVLLGPAKSYFTITEGSPRMNEKQQVLGESGEPIPGLYAVGQNGLGGQILWGHGLHIAWATTSGRLAGKHVMQNGTT